MKIHPETSNAISIELDDGSVFRLRHAMHERKDYLYIQGGNLVISIFTTGLEWEEIAQTKQDIRISSTRARKKEECG